MKVVLTQSVEEIGQKGEVKEVKSGFARNYLFPKNLAILAGDPSANMLVATFEKQKKQQEEKAWQATEKANQVEGKEIVIEVKAGDKEQLFAAVQKEDILKAIKDQLSVEPENIDGVPLKKLGEHTITLDFGADKHARVIVKLVAAGPAKVVKKITKPAGKR